MLMPLISNPIILTTTEKCNEMMRLSYYDIMPKFPKIKSKENYNPNRIQYRNTVCENT